MPLRDDSIRGRGASDNPANRFETLHYDREDADAEDEPGPATIFLKDKSRSIIAYNDSPDVGFAASINPYRGCEHGCIYCYARPTHEYLGFSAGLDFETKILVKEDAPKLLRQELASPKWKPQTISISGVTDPYQPVERHFRLTRRCLEILAHFSNPVGIVTKSRLVTRDIDILARLAQSDAAVVFLSVTTLDGKLARIMEPRASHPESRLAAIEELHRAGIQVGVMAAPMIPGLTDHELPAILEAAVAAGARFAGYVPVRLPFALAPLFENWLTRHFPDKKDKVLSRIQSMRGGKLNDARFGVRMRGEGRMAGLLNDLFHITCRRLGIEKQTPKLTTASFRRPADQLPLFE